MDQFLLGTGTGMSEDVPMFQQYLQEKCWDLGLLDFIPVSGQVSL